MIIFLLTDNQLNILKSIKSLKELEFIQIILDEANKFGGKINDFTFENVRYTRNN